MSVGLIVIHHTISVKTIPSKSFLFVGYIVFMSINLNSFFFQIKICGNRQPLVTFILSLHFYSITFFNKSGRNYVDGQFCYNFYHRFAELLLNICQFFHFGRFASMIGSFATRFGSGVTVGDGAYWGNFPVEVPDYAQKVSYDWSYNICEKNHKKTVSYFSTKSFLFVVYNFFISMNLNIFASNEAI